MESGIYLTIWFHQFHNSYQFGTLRLVVTALFLFFGDQMAPGYQVDELLILQKRLAEMEAELERQKQRQDATDQCFRELLDAAPVMIWTAGVDALGTFFN